ncbi:MAG: M28 family peptidase [Gemmataceae bacterium]|nr:M28 family peptidase [Gemmataceae bacterium]
MTGLILMLALCADPFPYEKDERELSADIHEHELKAHVYRLAGSEFMGRSGDGGERAAVHIADAFRRLPLKPAFGDSYLQPIPWLLTTPRADGKKVVGRNVGAYLPGSDPALADEWIILAAHYDHLGVRFGKMHPGADDNASGVAMLLEVAEAMALAPEKPKRSVFFISFDLEEIGLQGSTHFVTNPPRPYAKLKAMLVADIIGRSMAGVMDEHLFVLGSETSPELTNLSKAVRPEAGLSVARLGHDLVGTRSDYGPFRDRKTPFLFFTTGVHKDYHRSTDLPDRINYAKLTKISRWIEAATRQVADATDTPKWDPAPLGPGLDEVAAVLELFNRSLAKPEVVPLTEDQRKRFEASRDRLKEIADRGTMTADDRVWLIRTAQWALLNVF